MEKITDISYHQGTINWAQAAKELALAIIRVQYGSNFIDPKYKEYVAGCKKHNIPFGHYAFCKFVSVADAVKEAEDFHARADKEARFLVADVEEATTRKLSGMAPATQAFIDALKKKGWTVGLYTGSHVYAQFGLAKVKADFLWIARYSSQRPMYACELWQYTDKGRVAGISGNVDLNRLNGTKQLDYFTGKGSPAPETLISYLQKRGIDSSKDNRTRLAKEYGIRNYDFSAAKNLELLAALKSGKKPEGESVAMEQLEKLQKQIDNLKKELTALKKKPDTGNSNEPDKAHADAWKWAAEQGLLNGDRPYEPVTREQLATVLKRMSGSKE